MRISDLGTALGFKAVQGTYEDREVSGAYTSDLLSDVMGKAQADAVLVTIQAHKNTVAVASLLGLAAVVLCNDRPLPADMVAAAEAEGVALFSTGLSQFEVSGLLWDRLRRPGA